MRHLCLIRKICHFNIHKWILDFLCVFSITSAVTQKASALHNQTTEEKKLKKEMNHHHPGSISNPKQQQKTNETKS